ncbi:MAG: hypothetical protein JSS91_07555 [Bacteroidetes bacterium]|nr:hypothetical protein [Bacteroidota bacterium]
MKNNYLKLLPVLLIVNILFLGCSKTENSAKESEKRKTDYDSSSYQKNSEKINERSYEDKNYIPVDLEDALSYLDNVMDRKSKNEFRNTEEVKAVAGKHFSWGLYLRNNWGLWSFSSGISLYFLKTGVFHADDMSSIILTSFHRRLNGKDIRLDEQIKFYKEYRKDMENTE